MSAQGSAAWESPSPATQRSAINAIHAASNRIKTTPLLGDRLRNLRRAKAGPKRVAELCRLSAIRFHRAAIMFLAQASGKARPSTRRAIELGEHDFGEALELAAGIPFEVGPQHRRIAAVPHGLPKGYFNARMVTADALFRRALASSAKVPCG